MRLGFKVLLPVFLAFIIQSNAFGASTRSTTSKRYKLTILAYMNGFESVVDPVVTGLINKMETSGSTDQVAIVAQWGSLKTGKTKRLLIKRDADLTQVNSPVISESEADMGQAETLKDFLITASHLYPSEKLIVILAGHGSGWTGFSFDERFNSKIPVPELGSVMSQLAKQRGQKTDLLVFDSCVMSMVEVASEFVPSTRYLTASMDKLPDDIWIPYDLAFNAIKKNLDRTPRTWGKIFSQSYFDVTQNINHSKSPEYPNGIDGIQIATFNLGALEAVERVSAKIAKALIDLKKEDLNEVLEGAKANGQKYYFPYYVDLVEWLERLPDGKAFDQLRALNRELRANVNHSRTFQARSDFYPHSSGLTISLTPSKPANWIERYRALRWTQQTGWLNFLKRAAPASKGT